jgi:hypothetical protein
MVSSAVWGVATVTSLLEIWLFSDIVTRYPPYQIMQPIVNLLPTLSGHAASIAVILLGSIYYTWVMTSHSRRTSM